MTVHDPMDLDGQDMRLIHRVSLVPDDHIAGVDQSEILEIRGWVRGRVQQCDGATAAVCMGPDEHGSTTGVDELPGLGGEDDVHTSIVWRQATEVPAP